MKFNMTKRKELEKVTYDVFKALDPTGQNAEHYKKVLGKMTNKEFEDFFKQLFEDENNAMILHTIDYERDMDVRYAEDAAKLLGVPLEEELIMPHVNMDLDKPIVSPVPYIIGYAIPRRVQQRVLKKNSTSIKIKDRSAITGQVTGDDKNGRSSDMENIALAALNADNIMRELNGFRADNMSTKNQAYSQISEYGNCTLDDLQEDVRDKTMLNTVDVMFIGMGIDTDLIIDGPVRPDTLEKL